MIAIAVIGAQHVGVIVIAGEGGAEGLLHRRKTGEVATRIVPLAQALVEERRGAWQCLSLW